jgi:recombination protein RecR
MTSLPASVEALIEELTRLPGIGRRGAERIVTHLLAGDPERASELTRAVERMIRDVRDCRNCGSWSEGELCPLCEDERRATGRLCVVETAIDLYAFEQSGVFDGRYHVLGGTLSPLGGIGPEDLRVEALVERVPREKVREVILATSPTVEGDATAIYVGRRLAPLGVEVARIGLGLPLGASLGYADPGTLRLALEGRRKLAS